MGPRALNINSGGEVCDVFDRFNGLARRAMLLAFREARRCQHDFLGTEHVLFGLLCDSTGPAAQLLRALGTPPESVLGHVQELMLDDETTAALERFPLSPAVRRAFESASQAAQQLGQQLVGPEHLLLGLLHEPASEAALVLGRFGIHLANARQQAALLPPAEKADHLVRTAAKASGPETGVLDSLVAPSVVAEPTPEPADALEADVTMPPRVVLSQHVSVLDAQLRITQLALGSVVGFALGCLMEDTRPAILFTIIGFAVAAVRSSLLGAAAGFTAGLMLPSLAPEFNDHLEGGRLLLATLGALVGSLLGNFWRRPLERLGAESPMARELHERE
jgi:ATP-dependent Clp protease ATP-binding subunit ClpC